MKREQSITLEGEKHKVQEGWALGGSGRVEGLEAEVRVRAIPTSGSLGIRHHAESLGSLMSPWPQRVGTERGSHAPGHETPKLVLETMLGGGGRLPHPSLILSSQWGNAEGSKERRFWSPERLCLVGVGLGTACSQHAFPLWPQMED